LHPGFGRRSVGGQRGVKNLPRQRADVAVEQRFCGSLLHGVTQVGQDLLAALKHRIAGMPHRQLARAQRRPQAAQLHKVRSWRQHHHPHRHTAQLQGPSRQLAKVRAGQHIEQADTAGLIALRFHRPQRTPGPFRRLTPEAGNKVRNGSIGIGQQLQNGGSAESASVDGGSSDQALPLGALPDVRCPVSPGCRADADVARS